MELDTDRLTAKVVPGNATAVVVSFRSIPINPKPPPKILSALASSYRVEQSMTKASVPKLHLEMKSPDWLMTQLYPRSM